MANVIIRSTCHRVSTKMFYKEKIGSLPDQNWHQILDKKTLPSSIEPSYTYRDDISNYKVGRTGLWAGHGLWAKHATV